MAQITSSVGLISGINTGAIINELLSLDAAPINNLQNQITSAQDEQQAYSQFSSQLTSIQTVATSLQNPQTYQASTATSSNNNVLTATTSPGAAVGTYQFQVAQLVSSQQSVSNGYADPNQAKVQAGTMTFDLGGGEISSATALDALNGGAGVTRGQFRITDASGQSTTIDTTSDVSLDDVVNQINSDTGISVRASIVGNALHLTDESGGAGQLTVKDLGTGTAAKSLGIVGAAVNGTLTGTDLNYLSRDTALSQLNDGRGVRSGSTSGGADFTITAGGNSYNFSLTATMSTVGDVIDAINSATGGAVTASIAPNSMGITLTASGGAAVSVSAANNPYTAQDLGIEGTAAGGTLTGQSVLASIDSVLVSSLQGGSGMQLGTISITDRDGNAASIDLSGATSFQDIINDINNAGLDVQAAVNSAGDGIEINDTSNGGGGNIVISDVSGNTAAELGITGTFSTTDSSIQGTNLHRQYITQNTQLSSMNGGTGITPGEFDITTASGQTAEIDLSSSNYQTLGQVMTAINTQNIGVTASINANGNGLLLTDNTTGAGHLTVTDVNSTTAADLNIAGTATGNTIDGSYEKTLQVTANDTLSTLATKINGLNAGVTASIINTGSGATPYRLSINAVNTGLDGRTVIDTGTTGLQFQNLVNAQNAAVFVGGAGGAQPLLITSSSNQLANVIQGATITLNSVSSQPVTLSISADDSGVVTQINNFVTAFNSIVDQINTLTSFNTSTNTAGLLLGDSTTQMIQEDLYSMISGVVSSAGQYKTLAQLGLTLNNNSELAFDQNTFDAAYAADPQSVQNLFTEANTGVANVMEQQVNNLTDPIHGILTLQNQTLSNQTQGYQDQINFLNQMLDDKRNVLEEQFNNMEETLATLESQQATLSAMVSAGAAKAATSSSTTSSSDSSSDAYTSSSGTSS